MASQKSMLDLVLFQLSGLRDISWRAMMGEFIIYYHGRVIGGIYDDRFLVKMTPSAMELMPEAEQISPYPGAKTMLLVERVEDSQFLKRLFESMESELPAPRKKAR